jgi:phenylalanyl-tRNA synthetase beta chain
MASSSMQTSLSWLQTHIDLSDHSTQQLSDLLTFAGVEVEGIETQGIESDKVVIAQIKEFVQHPNADKLSVCQVDDGSGTAKQIVCGAKNFKAGDKVPLALPGAVLPGGFEIKVGALRGVESQGMMCSGKELGLGDDHGGLLILDAASPIGTPLRDVMGKANTLFELEITPNRSDLLSHLGLARELAALTGKALIGQRDHAGAKAKTHVAKDSEVKLSAEACPYYAARIVRAVKVGPSPEWLREHLEAIGLRPINNIVDITNYVLMEMGQPLHAFDLGKLSGGIHVRQAADGETLVALDGQTYTLSSEDMVIADSAKALAIAGVMGGLDSGVTETTTDILLEAAYFTPSNIRRTARRLALGSDSSYRYERGVDPQQTLGAAELAIKLITELAGGSPEGDYAVAGAAPVLTAAVSLDEARARRLLGMPDLSTAEMHDILSKLGLTLQSSATDSSAWTVPSYRLDLQRGVDLIEELARVIGLDRVPSRYSAAFVPSDAPDRVYDQAMALRHALAGRGYHEAQTLRLIATSQLPDSLGVRDASAEAVALKNPLSEDHTTLRPSIIPGLLSTAANNIRQGLQRLRFFEIGRIFLKLPNGQTREEERLAILLSGPLSLSGWAEPNPGAAALHDLKGSIESLIGSSLEVKSIKDLPNTLLTHELKQGNRTLGWIAQLHPKRARELDARHPIYIAELPLSSLRQGSTGPKKFEELPRFPSVTRDVAFEAASDLAQSKVATFFASQKEPLLIGTTLFDVYADPSGQRIPAGRKSMAYTLTYRAGDKTLDTKEVDLVHSRILAALEKQLPITVRR